MQRVPGGKDEATQERGEPVGSLFRENSRGSRAADMFIASMN